MRRSFILIGITEFGARTAITAVLMQYAPYFMQFFLIPGLPSATQTFIARALAWTIIMVAQFIGAFSYPIGGSLGDRTKTKYGKYRPFFLLGIPCGIALVFAGFPAFLQLIFAGNVPISFIFLLIMVIIFFVTWRLTLPNFMSYYTYCIDESEKRELSGVLNIADVGSILVAFMIPMVFDQVPFEIFSYIFAAMVLIPYLLLFFLGPDEPTECLERTGEPSLIKSIKQVVNKRYLRLFVLSAFCFNFGYSMFSTFIIDYLKTFSLAVFDLLLALGALMLVIGVFVIIFLRLTKNKSHLKTFRVSLLFISCVFPLLLILGPVNLGIPRMYLFFVALIVILMGMISFLLYSYVIIIDLSNIHPEIKSSFMGVYNFFAVLAQPVATLIYIFLGIFNTFPVFPLWLNLYPIMDIGGTTIIAYTYVFGYCLVGIVGSFGFLGSYLILRRLDYAEPETEVKGGKKSAEKNEKLESSPST